MVPARTLRAPAETFAALADEEPLRMGGVPGKGGMATVYAATQVALGRTVAVKVPDGQADSPRVAAMLAEAVVTGQLEHPGIVPVHTLDTDAEGRPRLVLKRIEGQSWQSMLAGEDPAASAAEPPRDRHPLAQVGVRAAVVGLRLTTTRRPR